MSEGRRPYRSALREEQARVTRRAVVEAARDLFVEVGWSRTTIDAVAEQAGVSRRTVFTAVGGKAALLKLPHVLAVAADDDAEAAEVHATSERNRLGGAWGFVGRLETIGGLRAGLSGERAVAAALVLMDPAVHRTLVVEHGWTREEYAGWIERSAVAELLGEGARD